MLNTINFYKFDFIDNKGETACRVDDPTKFIDNLKNPDQIIIPYQKIRVRFDFPLTYEFNQSFKSITESGFTIRQLATLVSQRYHIIYDVEDKTTTMIIRRATPFPLNRSTTNGEYGIWGYNIEDLVIEGIKQINIDIPIHNTV
jgi:hypothetical protein